ncbi:MAG TPA: glycosyltransferase family 2 protein [Blastocatellia bacterium]|nr:glycosyltransferase family 2 protein [Blastocatellia bacterium]
MTTIFWVSVAAIAYTYLGYPLVISLLADLRGRKVVKRSVGPRVCVVIACHNEANTVARRIKNLLQSDYPAELLHLIVVSDGSTDGTEEVARRFQGSHVRVFAYEQQRGKAVALNAGASFANGDVIVFTDARQEFDRRAIRELAANFADPSVGAVTGELVLTNDQSSPIGEAAGLYWKYEKWIRKNEARFDSCIGATGAIYAIRQELWRHLPPGLILDDVYTPMHIALAGYRVIFEEKAKAYDKPSLSAHREFQRKCRTLAGNYQLCAQFPRLLAPAYRLVFQFYSHKLMRLVAPLFFISLLASSLAISAETASSPLGWFYLGVVAAQAAFYLSVAAGWLQSGRDTGLRLFKAPYVFMVMNVAAVAGFFYFIFGKRNIWVRGD